MKTLSFIRTLFCAAVLFGATRFNAHAGVFKNWTNSAGGNYFDPFGWSPNGVPQAGDAVTITNNGTYTVYAPTGTVNAAVFTIGGASGKQTFVYGTIAAFQLILTNSVVNDNGVLAITNGGFTGALLIQPGGELQFNSLGSLYLYNLAITNRGTLTWSNGSLTVGGSNQQTTYVTNSGLWRIFGDNSMASGGGNPSVCFNSGMIKKIGGSGSTTFGMDVVNSPSGVVDAASGTLKLAPNSTNFLSGSFVAENTSVISYQGNESDAGGVVSGTGSHQFTFGNFYFRTSTIPNLKLVGGDAYITGATTFQNAGVITNLTLDGTVLHGTNRVSGVLTLNAGQVVDQLTILPGGQLNLAAPGTTLFYGLTLFNQGTVNWSSGSINVGGTVISNGGLWTITGDYPMNNGGGAAYFTNYGTLQKTVGTGISTVQGPTFINLPSGIIRAASGTLQMPNNYTNIAGELQLAGGTLTAGAISGTTFYMAGGTLDGFGTIGSPAQFDGGVVQPGPAAGLMRFQSSLVLGTNCTLSLAGTGTVPGVSYDQLSVTGAVAISNCTLQVSSLPTVPGATRFVIITNNSVTPVAGTFNGLPEDAPLTISGQPFHIHYSGGNGNDVVLMRDLPGGPLLSTGGYSNKTFRFTGIGNNPTTIYTIQATTNFVQWTNLGKATGDINGDFNFVDTNAAGFNRRFYRTTN